MEKLQIGKLMDQRPINIDEVMHKITNFQLRPKRTKR